MPDSWGPSSANPVPTTCSKTTITGTYSAVAPPFPTSTAQCVAAVTVPVTFWLIENTYYGENVYMTGNVSALGDWNASAGYSLNAGLYTSDENLWFATVKGLEPGVTMEYKFYKIEPGNSVTFEGGGRTGCMQFLQHVLWRLRSTRFGRPDVRARGPESVSAFKTLGYLMNIKLVERDFPCDPMTN